MMRLAVVQTNPRFGHPERNVASALTQMTQKSADLYVLPELCNTGYNIRTVAEIDRMAEPTGEGPTYRAMEAHAKKQRCYIVYGFAEKRGRRRYNSAALVGPRGLLGIYRKTHLFGKEKRFFSPGDTGFPVYPLPFGRVGLMICFDWYFPESARTLAMKGAQLIAHPSNLVLPNCPEGMKTRCLENRVFAATADRVGVENRGGIRLRYIGMSEIVSPKGRILVRLSQDREELKVVSIDLREADRKWLNPWNHLLKDRRPRFYHR